MGFRYSHPGLSFFTQSFCALILCVVLESVVSFDRFFQNLFFKDGAWLLTKDFHATHQTLLYTLPKIGIAAAGVSFLALFLFTCTRSRAALRLAAWKKPALLVVLSLVLIPLLVACGKAVSGVYGPASLLPYGGAHPHIGLLQQLWLYGYPAGGRSFPAGHASGGFALMALYYLPVPRFAQKTLFAFGLGMGWMMGLYQMARGEHFLSHTLTSMCLALSIISVLAWKLRPESPTAMCPAPPPTLRAREWPCSRRRPWAF